MTNFTASLLEGFLLNLGLIVGFGPQNTLILRQALRRQHLMLMVVLCTLIDVLMIGLGTAGVEAMFQGKWANWFITLAGVTALLVYGARSFKAAFSPVCEAQPADLCSTPTKLVLALLAVSLFNPSVYIDTLLLIGGSSSQYQGSQCLWFVLGASAASLVWFLGLSYGSALISPWLRQPKVLRRIDLLSGSILWLMAFRLLTHLG